MTKDPKKHWAPLTHVSVHVDGVLQDLIDTARWVEQTKTPAMRDTALQRLSVIQQELYEYIDAIEAVAGIPRTVIRKFL